MEEHEPLSAMTGHGLAHAEKYLAKARSAATTEEKIAHLTDAIELLLLHVKSSDSEREREERNRHWRNV